MNKTSRTIKITKTGVTVLVLGVYAMFATAPSFAAESTQTNDTFAMQSLIKQRYDAQNEIFEGNADPIKDLWSHQADVLLVGTTSVIAMGWPAVEAEFEAQAAKKLGGKVDYSNVEVTLGSNTATVVNDEKATHMDANGNIYNVTTHITHILRKEDGKWKIRLEHTEN
ncbi:MAG: nuclear transport factor 2 family protein [Bacteroidetes bacterium]|nr:nuclear transport factor 2 family protein [Bacteroidota bacterium]